MASPRVLIVGNFLSSHGASRGVCEELALKLQSSGWTVTTTSDKRSRPRRLMHMLATAWNRRHEYDVAQVDVYSGAAFFWAEAVCWVLRRARQPYVLTLHGGGLPEFARSRRRRVQHLLATAKAVTVPSPYLLHQMAEFRPNLTLLPNGLEISAYQSRRTPSVQPRLMWVRAFHTVYNPMMMPRVLARLKDEFPSIHLTMVGPDKGDSAREQTLAEAKAYHVEDHLEIRGPVPKTCVPDVLAAGDIFLNTSNVDNTPVTVLEAMASGLCVVSTQVGGIPYLLRSGEEAVLVPPNDDAAMAAAIRRILMDRAFAQRLQSASLQKVCGFDWRAIIPMWRDVLSAASQSSSSYSSSELVHS